MKKLNPIWFLVGFNLIFLIARTWIIPPDVLDSLNLQLQATLATIGPPGYLGVVALFAICAFFFIPLMIPLNILCGAAWGPATGTAVAIVGVTAGCYASTLSVRHVFTGMRQSIENRATAQQIIKRVNRHGPIIVLLVRLAFVVPYLIQNMVLAVTKIDIHRLAALTAIGGLPAAAIYSFLGAGLVRAETLSTLAVYLAVPLILLIVLSVLLRFLERRYDR